DGPVAGGKAYGFSDIAAMEGAGDFGAGDDLRGARVKQAALGELDIGSDREGVGVDAADRDIAGFIAAAFGLVDEHEQFAGGERGAIGGAGDGLVGPDDV